MVEKNRRSQALAVGLTVLVFVGVLLLARRNQKTESAPEAPEAAIWAVVEASKNGDVKAYLDCFTEDLARSLRKTAETMTAQKFADYLQQTNREIKGFAVSEISRTREDEAVLRVELVYKDKNEVQEYSLKKIDGVWKVREVKSTERVRTLVPYGTEVTPTMEKK